jgi:lipid-A-disaccharide synthase-like uncharacterized protein
MPCNQFLVRHEICKQLQLQKFLGQHMEIVAARGRKMNINWWLIGLMFAFYFHTSIILQFLLLNHGERSVGCQGLFVFGCLSLD